MERAKARRRNTFIDLLSIFHHADHKLSGLFYIVSFFTAVYFIVFRTDEYEKNLWLHCVCPLAGVVTTLTALRNFRFLPKKAENPGMFAENRTFSYAFLQENLWFQFLLGWTLFAGHPLSTKIVPPIAQVLVLFFIFYIREIVPKTSYKSWETGNEKVNKKKGYIDIDFINLQVKIVRWNYVLKKTLLYYMVILFQSERLNNQQIITQPDRIFYYLLTLDAMHNVTTAFFLQTLKFKKFISAQTFSFLFNVTPIIGVFFTGYLLFFHSFQWGFVLAVGLDTFINIKFIYPIKSLPHLWKNRIQVAVKVTTATAAFIYYYRQN